MSNYLESNVVTLDEVIKLRPEKNPIKLIFWWIGGILGCWLLLIPTINAIRETVRYNTTEYLITNKKVYEKYGWISTHTDEMPLSKIENVTVTYTFWGKIFNYGTVNIQGANHNNVHFTEIKNAEEIRRSINNL